MTIKEQSKVKTGHEELISSNGKNLVEHLKNIGTWSGDDLEECLQAVNETRSKVKFETSNPFDEE